MSRWMTLAAAAPFGLLTMTGATSPPSDSSTPPGGSEVAVDAGPIGDPSLLEVDGLLDSISPDGRWIAGSGEDGTPCIWAVETLTATCADEVVGLGGGSERAAMSWSPDSQRVAFTPDVFVHGRDGDIFVMDLDGTLANLTDDGYAGGLFGDEVPADLAIDTLPTWSPDGTQIAFVRDAAAGAPPSIMAVDPDGGEPAELAVSPVASRFSVWPTMTWVADESILLTTNPADRDDPGHGVWTLNPATGEVTEVVAGPDRTFELTSVSPDGTTALVADPALLGQSSYSLGAPALTAALTELDLATGESTPPPWFDVTIGELAPPPEDAEAAIGDGLAPAGGPQAYSPDGAMWAGRYHALRSGIEYLVVGDVASGDLVGAVDLTSADLAVGASAIQWVDGGVFVKSGAGTAVWVSISTD